VLFEEAVSDSLLIYDTCESAETAFLSTSTSSRGITELISACGFQTSTPGPGKDSLSFALTKVLKEAAASGSPLSVSALYRNLLMRLMASRSGEKTTPIHITLVADERGRAIKLEPLKKKPKHRSQFEDKEVLTLGLYLQHRGNVSDDQRWRDWLLRAPPGLTKVLFSHPVNERGERSRKSKAESAGESADESTNEGNKSRKGYPCLPKSKSTDIPHRTKTRN
jgi:hypothetical protein